MHHPFDVGSRRRRRRRRAWISINTCASLSILTSIRTSLFPCRVSPLLLSFEAMDTLSLFVCNLWKPELIKVTHKHCYPDTRDVGIGKLAVRGGDYVYHLADYLCIGQVYNTSEGKVMAEVQQLPSLCAFGNDQKYLQTGPHELSTSSGAKKLGFPATDDDNCDNEGQFCVEPQSAEKATNHSVGPSIPQLLEGTILAEDPSRITAGALEGNAAAHEGMFVPSTVGCLDRENNMSPATQAPFTQESQELTEIPTGIEGEEDARDLETPGSRLVMQETPSDAGVAATGFLSKKKKKEKVKKRTVSLSEGEKQLEYLVKETDDVPTISKLQMKSTEATPASNNFKHEGETASLVKAEGKNELHIKRNPERNNGNDASESSTHLSAGPKQKSDLSPARSVSITTIQGKVKEKRKKKRALVNVAEVKTAGKTAPDSTLAVGEAERDTAVGGDASVAPPSGEKLRKKRRKKKCVDLEPSCVDDIQVGTGGEKVREASADRQCELETEQKEGHSSGKRKDKVSKLHRRSPTSGSPDAEAATNLQSRTSDATEGKMAMNVDIEGKDAADLRTVRKKGRRKRSTTDVSGADAMASTVVVGFPQPGTVQAEGETAGDNLQSTSQAHVAHTLKESSREDGDKASGSQQGAEEGEAMLTTDGSNVKDSGTGIDNREVVVTVVGLPQEKAETSFEQAKDGILLALDSLQGSPWPSGPVLGTQRGRGAPSGTSAHESSFDMMEEGTAARKETGFQNKRHRSGKHDSRAQSLERKEAAAQNEVLRLPFESQADEQVDGLMLGNERTLQKGTKSHKDSHSSKRSEGSEFRSDSAVVKKTQVGVLDHPGEVRESRATFTTGNGETFQKQEVKIIENTPVERGEDGTEKDSAQALSQDTSYKVAVTQVSNASSGSTTEETGQEIGLTWSKGTETKPHEQKIEALHSQVKDFIGLSAYSAGENGNPDTILSATAPSKAVGTPLPIVPRIQATGSAENIRRRSLGAAAEIESKFAQFIDSQDGLDEIMGITFSQRKIRSADLASQVASAGAVELPEAASGNGVLENGGESMPPLCGVPFTLEKPNSAVPLLQVPGKSLVSLPTSEFKVPKDVLPSTTAGRETANHNSGGPTHNSGRPTTILSKEVQEENSGENLKFFASDVQNVDAVVTGNENLQLDLKDQSSFALQGTIEADITKTSETIVEKRRRLRKRKENGLEFMVVNNTEQLVRDEMERKESGCEKRADVETPATMTEFSSQRGDGDNKTDLWRSGAADRREEDDQSQDTSLVSGNRKSGKKRRQSAVKREEIEVGLKESELPVNNAVSNIDGAPTCEEEGKTVYCQENTATGTRMANPQNVISEETSMDRSARETEELYLLMEKANTDLWVQTKGNNKKHGACKKQGACLSFSLLSGERFPAGASEVEVDKGEQPVKDDAQENIAGTRADGDVNEPRCNMGKESGNLESLADPKAAVRLQSSHLSATNSRVNDGLGHAIQGSDTMEMPDDGVKTTIEHGNVERENSGLCEEQEVKGATLLNQEKMQSDVDSFELESEDGDTTLVPRIRKSGNKSQKRQAERMEEMCERAVSMVLEDEMLHVADPDFVLQRKSRKDANPTSWSSKTKGSKVSETVEEGKLGVVQSSVTTKKASKSSKSGGDTSLKKKMVVHKPVMPSGSAESLEYRLSRRREQEGLVGRRSIGTV